MNLWWSKAIFQPFTIFVTMVYSFSAINIMVSLKLQENRKMQLKLIQCSWWKCDSVVIYMAINHEIKDFLFLWDWHWEKDQWLYFEGMQVLLQDLSVYGGYGKLKVHRLISNFLNNFDSIKQNDKFYSELKLLFKSFACVSVIQSPWIKQPWIYGKKKSDKHHFIVSIHTTVTTTTTTIVCILWLLCWSKIPCYAQRTCYP